MTLSTAQANFGLEELANIDGGIKNKGKHNENSMTEKLMGAYEGIVYDKNLGYLTHTLNSEIDNSLYSYFTKNKIEYSEQDISDLVEYANVNDFDKKDVFGFGAYVGSLISMLTEKNEKLGKHTIIEIPENHLDYLGNKCEKFDVVKIGVNYGSGAFAGARKGNLLYVEDCKGNLFAYGAGTRGGNIKMIIGTNVSGDDFAYCAGRESGNIGAIVGVNVSGLSFADYAGNDDGKIGKILKNSRKADIEYNKIVDELNKEYNLGLQQVKVREPIECGES
ncbi:MAG: hypothetical protein PHH61_00335 [Candidatus Nanoarchaeia archaeon]|nr:hypothetical protein [Candidatus Nanoarchaeia archaeon]